MPPPVVWPVQPPPLLLYWFPVVHPTSAGLLRKVIQGTPRPLPRLEPRPVARGEAPIQVEALDLVRAETRVRVEDQVWVEAQALVAAEVLAQVWFQGAESVVGALTAAPAAQSVALPPVALAVVVSPPHSAASPLLPSLPPPKTSLEECHRCRKGEKMQSEGSAAPAGSSDP